MVRNKDSEAKVHLGKVYKKIMQLKEKENAIGNIEAALSPNKAENLPSIEFRMQTVRFLVELEEYKKGVKYSILLFRKKMSMSKLGIF